MGLTTCRNAGRVRGIRRSFPAGPLFNHIEQISDDELDREDVVPVRTAKVVVANYAAIVHDFPHVFAGPDALARFALQSCETCRTQRRICPDAIDSWLLTNAAFVSRQQSLPNGVNTAIDHGAPVKKAYRPPMYGRALVVPIEEPAPAGCAGFLDIKGAGVGPGIVPSHLTHSNGLEYLGIALADFFYGWLLDRIFQRTVPGYRTVPVYAVIDLGFDVTNGHRGTAPAGLHVRRAHAREKGGIQIVSSGGDEEKVMMQIEFILRTHGITTTRTGTTFSLINQNGAEVLAYGRLPVACKNEREEKRVREITELVRGSRLEITNIQMTRGASWKNKTAHIVDLGHVSARRTFDYPFANQARDALLKIGRILVPGDARFVVPDPRVAVDPDICNRHTVNACGLYAAQAFRSAKRDVGTRDVEIFLRIGIARALGHRLR